MTYKLFTPKPGAERRTVSKLIKWTVDEMRAVEHSASIRQLNVAEFIRRAALGRRADVRYDTEIVLALRDTTRSIRELRAALLDKGFVPPDTAIQGLIDEAIAAMVRIDK